MFWGGYRKYNFICRYLAFFALNYCGGCDVALYWRIKRNLKHFYVGKNYVVVIVCQTQHVPFQRVKRNTKLLKKIIGVFCVCHFSHLKGKCGMKEIHYIINKVVFQCRLHAFNFFHIYKTKHLQIKICIAPDMLRLI